MVKFLLILTYEEAAGSWWMTKFIHWPVLPRKGEIFWVGGTGMKVNDVDHKPYRERIEVKLISPSLFDIANAVAENPTDWKIHGSFGTEEKEKEFMDILFPMLNGQDFQLISID